MSILVIGSSNTDMIVKANHLPLPGETVLGEQFLMQPGGKGANQAVAAARLGAKVALAAKLGDDLFGKQTLKRLEEEGINQDYIFIESNQPSGVALITVDSQGENSIVVASGANMAWRESDLVKIEEAIAQALIILLQLEIPVAWVELVAKTASTMGKTIILNPAPARLLSESLLAAVNILTPNQTEAEALTGIKVDSIAAAKVAGEKLLKSGVKNVIITMGKQGAYLHNQEISQLIPSYSVETLDTTGAGDSFNGALAVALLEAKEIIEAIKFANRVASISVTRLGAQSSFPYRDELGHQEH